MKKTLLLSILALLGMSQVAAQEDSYLPLVREGVIWVNEKVIVNHGDTTKYYYKYEFSGLDSIETNLAGEINNACYYYTGNNLDVEQDSLIAGIRDKGGYVTCVRNDAYFKSFYDNRCLFPLTMFTDGGTIILYWLVNDDPIRTIEYYLRCQEWTDLDVLTTENFTIVDPITIDGTICNRCAFVNEQGDTAAYVVEGIGFDSRDMGDLLTPFTRKPDPNADYQEYCGLSHVIKDGKIIYKGMRFNPDAIVLPGDVDGDGEITISDANSVIDIVVMGGNAGHTHSPAADANGDGEVTIADVNTIVNMIMDN
jgi:hypothetical protein